MPSSIVVFIVGVISAIAVPYMLNEFYNYNTKATAADEFFSDDYYAARAKFRSAVRASDFVHHILPLSNEHSIKDLDLTIDIGVRIGTDPKSILIHVSGTHGVEGFAGSAIQSAIFNRTFLNKSHTDTNKKTPTIVFVHALNPYGFAKLRRVNENNIDLNRNYLNEEEFNERVNRDPNRFGYVNLYDMINPQEAINWADLFYFRVIFYVLRYGYSTLKECVVTGNNHFPKSLFYGGTTLQTSHRILKEFLQKSFDVESIKRLVVVDVHTGLGRRGVDTIGIHSIDESANANDIFKNATDISQFNAKGERDDAKALSGYTDVSGYTPYGLAKLFPNAKNKLTLTQEFGTLPGLVVFKALRAENAMYHYGKNCHASYAEDLRDVFYLRSDSKWKSDIVSRGIEVFNQTLNYICV